MMNSFEERALERERFLHQKVRSLLIMQTWTMFQSLLFIGIAVFSLILAVGGLAQLARWFTVFQNFGLSFPGRFAFPEFVNASSTMPNPRMMEMLAQFPLWGIKDATVTALVVMSLIFVFRIWKAYRLWSDVRKVKQAIAQIDAELERLRQSADHDER